MADDLLPPITGSDDEAEYAESSDDEFAGTKAVASGMFADLLGPSAKRARGSSNSASASTAAARREKAAAGAAVKASWSFKDAIERIDATEQRRSATSLQEKVAAVRARRAGGGAAAAPAAIDEDGASDEEDDSDDEDDDEDKNDDEDEEEAACSSDDDDDAEEDDDDAADAADPDADAGADVEAAAGAGSSSAAAAAASSGDADDDADADADDGEEGGDAVDAILASAKPNPFQERDAERRAAEARREKAYASIFTADPFAEGAGAAGGKGKGKKGSKAAAAAAAADGAEGAEDTLRAVGGAGAAAAGAAGSAAGVGAKRRRPDDAAGAEGGDAAAAAAAAAASAGGTVGEGTAVTVTGLAPGQVLREPRTFAEANLSRPLLRAVADLGYAAPTPIQRRAIPLALAGHDIVGSAVTGSGKTAAYLLPILERLQYRPSRSAAIRVIVLTPTRELAAQVHSMCGQLASHCGASAAGGIRAALIVGGLSLKQQEAELRARPDIVIATPGRLLDHIRNSMAVHCDDVDVLVLDEADRLLEMGFEDEVMEIVKACPPGRQTLLFSATMTPRVETLIKLSLRKPVRLLADPLYDMASRLSQEFVRVRAGREGDREAMLLALVTRNFTGGGVLIFAIHKRTAHRLAILLAMAGLKASELHGNLTQRQRLQALEDFRSGAVDYLIATDLAGRGLDIAGVRAVINYEMPVELTAYVHRVGRTARAGRAGVAVTLVSEHQRAAMKEVVRRATLNVKSRVIAPEAVEAWRARIDSWAGDIDAVIMSEREERQLRLAEMEADKADNIIKHSDEIRARPARTWFKSEGEKAATREAAAEAATGRASESAAALAADAAAAAAAKRGGGADERGNGKGKGAGKEDKDKKPHRLTRAKKRRMEARAEDERDARRVAKAEALAAKAAKAAAAHGTSRTDVEERARGGGGSSGGPGGRFDRSGGADGDDAGAGAGGGGAKAGKIKLDPDMARLKKSLATAATTTGHAHAKSFKASVRDTALRLGVTSGIAERIVAREQQGKGKKGGKPKAGGGGGGGAGKKAGGGGGSSGFASEGLRGARGFGGGPSKGSFKSKAKFKRR